MKTAKISTAIYGTHCESKRFRSPIKLYKRDFDVKLTIILNRAERQLLLITTRRYNCKRSFRHLRQINLILKTIF